MTSHSIHRVAVDPPGLLSIGSRSGGCSAYAFRVLNKRKRVDNLRRSGDEDAMVRQGQAESSGGSETPEGKITQIRSLIGPANGGAESEHCDSGQE